MAVITINGQIGGGAREIGQLVANRLGYDYVDVRILNEAAKRLGATVESLTLKEQHLPTRGERFGRFLTSVLERSAVASTGSDIYFGPALGGLLAQDYPQAAAEPVTREDQREDQRYIEAIKAVILGLAEGGNVVVISRASNIILKGRSGALHVGLVSTFESRAALMAKRENVSLKEGESIAREHERARAAFFRRYFQAAVDNPNDYHLMLNTHWVDHSNAAGIIVEASAHVC